MKDIQVQPRKKTALFQTFIYPNRKQQEHIFLIIPYYKLQDRAQDKVGSYTGEPILLEDHRTVDVRTCTLEVMFWFSNRLLWRS